MAKDWNNREIKPEVTQDRLNDSKFTRTRTRQHEQFAQDEEDRGGRLESDTPYEERRDNPAKPPVRWR